MDSDNAGTVVQLNQFDIGIAQKIKQLHDAAYAVEARLLGLDEFPPLKRTLESYTNAPSKFFGYMRNGDVIGSVEIQVDEPSVYEVASLVVDPSYARQGIATKLMVHVLKIAGTSRVIVSTAKGNYPAIKLYERLGFRKVDRWLTDDGLDIVQLAKSANHCEADRGR